jgi:hypothetical protein
VSQPPLPPPSPQHSKDRFDEGSFDDYRRGGGGGGVYEEESVLSDSAVVEEEVEEYRPSRRYDSYDEVEEPEEPGETNKPKVFHFSGPSPLPSLSLPSLLISHRPR